MKKGYAIGVMASVMVLFALFFVYPAWTIVSEAFWKKGGGFTLSYVVAVFHDPVYLEGLWNAFLLGMTSTVVTLMIAFPLAMLGHKYDFTGKKWMETVVEISDKNCVKMDLVELPTGFYQLILMNEKGGFVSKKIVVVR